MDIMREYQIPVPKGFMATGAAEAQDLYAKQIGQSVPVVVKAMVLAGMPRLCWWTRMRHDIETKSEQHDHISMP